MTRLQTVKTLGCVASNEAPKELVCWWTSFNGNTWLWAHTHTLGRQTWQLSVLPHSNWPVGGQKIVWPATGNPRRQNWNAVLMFQNTASTGILLQLFILIASHSCRRSLAVWPIYVYYLMSNACGAEGLCLSLSLPPPLICLPSEKTTVKVTPELIREWLNL